MCSPVRVVERVPRSLAAVRRRRSGLVVVFQVVDQSPQRGLPAAAPVRSCPRPPFVPASPFLVPAVPTFVAPFRLPCRPRCLRVTKVSGAASMCLRSPIRCPLPGAPAIALGARVLLCRSVPVDPYLVPPACARAAVASDTDNAKPAASNPKQIGLFDILHLLSWRGPGPTRRGNRATPSVQPAPA